MCQALSIWMCKLHNTVNKQNNKPEFPCEQHKLDLMYLKNCNECKEKFEDGEAHKAAVLSLFSLSLSLSLSPLSRTHAPHAPIRVCRGVCTRTPVALQHIVHKNTRALSLARARALSLSREDSDLTNTY